MANNQGYYRARKEIQPRKGKGCGLKTPKWQQPRNQKLLDKACAYLCKCKEEGKLADWEKVLKILSKSISSCPPKSIASAKTVLRQNCRYEFDDYNNDARISRIRATKAGAKGLAVSHQNKKEYRKNLKEAGLNHKEYWAYLRYSCQNRTVTTAEIRLLNSTIDHAIEQNKPEVEIGVLRAKRGMAKRHFMQLKY